MKFLAPSMISTCLPPSERNGTLLWHLNHDDTLPEDPLLAVALANPEYVTALDDGWYLLLGIVCDNGQGIYLVFPDTTVITQLRNLIEALNHE